MRRVGRVGVVLLVLTSASVFGCVDDSKRISVGMTEREVREALGEPSHVEDQAKYFEVYLDRSRVGDCAMKAAKVLYYEHRFKYSVVVGIDKAERVICADGGNMHVSR